MTDQSGRITKNRESYLLLAANTAPNGVLRFQNVSGSDLWLNFGSPAMPAGGSYQVVPNKIVDETYLDPTQDIFIYGCIGASYTLKIG